jgi:glutathione S-transferase
VLVEEQSGLTLPDASIIVEYWTATIRGAAAPPPMRIYGWRCGDRPLAMLDTCYGWLDTRMADRAWAAGDGFTLADCAAAPALFYADWVHPIGEAFSNVAAYRARLLARPSVKRVVDEARPFRPLFPGGAPDRD